MMKKLLIVLWWLSLTLVLNAQDAPYTWVEGDLTLMVPPEWDEPLPGASDSPPTLYLAQTLVDAPDIRPPGIPMITLTLLPSIAADLPALLTSELQTLDVDVLEDPAETTLLDADAVEISGTNADGTLFGIGRAAAISDTEVLIVSGRGQAIQREEFTATYTALIDSLVSERAPIVRESAYGVLWHHARTLADGEDAFLNLAGLGYAADLDRLYTFERDLGVVEVDAVSGEILGLVPNPDITAAVDMTAGPAGVVYVADTDCACIYVRDVEGEWSEVPITGFGEGAPASIAAGIDGRLYATNQESDGAISIWVLRDGSRESALPLDPGIFEQPFLATDSGGRVLALTQYGEVLALSGNTPNVFADLGPLPETVTDFTLNSANQIVLTTADFGVMIFSADGEELDRPGRIVPNFPLAGEFVSPRGAAADADGTLYIVDSDGSFGAITAMSTQVAPGRVGGTSLVLNLPVQGLLSENTTQQTWTYDGQAGQIVTVSALDASGEGWLNPALRLIAPDGREAAANDDQDGGNLPGLTDAQIVDYPLETDGTYIVVVERVEGEGAYLLGISETQAFALGAAGVTTLTGEIGDVFPAQRWLFDGRAGQTLTITMQPTSGTLDPALRLLSADGTLIAENDDGDDPALGTSAQIFAAILPQDGGYVIEARRFEGEGRYELVVVEIGAPG